MGLKNVIQVSGLVSIHAITEPILVPSHLNLKQPELSFFIGDLTTKNEPTLVLRAITKLFLHFEKRQKEARSSDNKNSNNLFSALLSEEENDSCGSIPLIVNTDGFVRYLGAEMLVNIVKAIVPTHIIHVSAKENDIVELDHAVESFRNQGIEIEKNTISPGRLSASRIASMDLRTLRYVYKHFIFSY